jgi:hypothetical protein
VTPKVSDCFQNRAILNIAPFSTKAHHLCRQGTGHGWKFWRATTYQDRRPPPLDLFPGSHIMFNYSTTNANKSLEPPLPERPYKPYAKKSALPGPPYEPYKGM